MCIQSFCARMPSTEEKMAAKIAIARMIGFFMRPLSVGPTVRFRSVHRFAASSLPAGPPTPLSQKLTRALITHTRLPANGAGVVNEFAPPADGAEMRPKVVPLIFMLGFVK